MDSVVAPLVTTTWVSSSDCSVTARAVSMTMASSLAIFAFPSSIRGSTKSTPHSSTRSMASSTPGWSYIGSCIAGAITTGTPAPSAVVAHVVTGCRRRRRLSCRPCSRSRVRRATRRPTRRRRTVRRASTRPVSSVTTSFPVAYSSDHGWTMLRALPVITARTVAPRRRSSWASSTVLTAAIDPVTPSATFAPATLDGSWPAGHFKTSHYRDVDCPRHRTDRRAVESS